MHETQLHCVIFILTTVTCQCGHKFHIVFSLLGQFEGFTHSESHSLLFHCFHYIQDEMLAGLTPMTCSYLQKHFEGSFNNHGYIKAKN